MDGVREKKKSRKKKKKNLKEFVLPVPEPSFCLFFMNSSCDYESAAHAHARAHTYIFQSMNLNVVQENSKIEQKPINWS